MAKNSYGGTPMRIQARQGSEAEKRYLGAGLPSGLYAKPKAIVPGIDPAPLDDLLYHGGKVVPEMEFQNVYLGSTADWKEKDVQSIDSAILRAMRDRKLNNVMAQYFPGRQLACDARPSFTLDDEKPVRLDEPDIQAKVIELYDTGKIKKQDLGTTIFNFVLPRGTVLLLEGSSSLRGLGGYHGSVHFKRKAKSVTLYYSANVFSQTDANGKENGIDVFSAPWKNVVGTLYHELNEFRTDPDVNDAIRTGNDDFLGWMSRGGEECGDQPIAKADELERIFKLVSAQGGKTRVPVQFMYSNAVHGAEGPIAKPHT